MHYATNRKVVGSRLDEVNEFFLIYLILPLHQAPRFTQPLTEMSTKTRKIMFLRSRARPVRRADNITTVPSVSRLSIQCGILNISQTYTHPRPVMGIDSILLYKTRLQNKVTKLHFRICNICLAVSMPFQIQMESTENYFHQTLYW
jgi:hypothetical protein